MTVTVHCAGAKLDMELAKRGNVPMQTFSRGLVMRRWHHRVSMRQNFLYRWRLYKVCSRPLPAQFSGGKEH